MRGWGEERWSLSPCLEHVCCGALSLVSEAPLPVSPYHQVNNTCLNLLGDDGCQNPA